MTTLNAMPKKAPFLPIEKEIYEPILAELKTFGISFEEKEYMMG